jgi:glutamine amidotransferase
MRREVTVVDYGIGNLFSVQRALEYNGAIVKMASDADAVASADRLVLPGVGAFADGMMGLSQRGLNDAVIAFAQTGKPLVGICLGMQMLGSASEEFGLHKGLGLIPGRVTAVPRTRADGTPHKIPHIGWTGLHPSTEAIWKDTLLDTTESGASVYLVHSFHLVPDNPAHLLADCLYGGHRITAAVRSGNIYGCQFHPEKSGPVGLAMLSSFLEL